MAKLDDFKESEKVDLKTCEVCGRKVKVISSIRITTRNYERRYVGSGRPVQSHYSIKPCGSCFKKLEEYMDKMISEVSE